MNYRLSYRHTNLIYFTVVLQFTYNCGSMLLIFPYKSDLNASAVLFKWTKANLMLSCTAVMTEEFSLRLNQIFKEK